MSFNSSQVKLFTTFLVSFVIFSCSTGNYVTNGKGIQKRKYTNGWFHETKSNIGNLNNLHQKSDLESTQKGKNHLDCFENATPPLDLMEEIEECFQLVENTSSDPFIDSENQIIQILANDDDEECDVIILNNGDEINAKVLEITQSETKYKMCDNIEGPTFVKNNSEIFKIKHPNGTSTLLSANNNSNSNQPNNRNNDTEKSNSGKSQIVALILAILVGLLGIHRFYLGHIGMGILYLLTAGLFGIGVIVDIILIATGSLKPKDGEYSEKL